MKRSIKTGLVAISLGSLFLIFQNFIYLQDQSVCANIKKAERTQAFLDANPKFRADLEAGRIP